MSNSATPNIGSLSIPSQTQPHSCWYCDRGEETLTTKLQKCGHCGLAEYCNWECQGGDWKLHKAKCKRLTEVVVDTDVKSRLRSGDLRRRLLTLSEGTVILSCRDPDITTIRNMNLAREREFEAPFYQCKSLLRVYLKGCTNLTSVGTSAFAVCSSLTSVALPDSLTHLGGAAFHSCSSLTSMVLPDSLTQLGDAAFSECSSLTSVVLPDSLTQVGLEAFVNCSSLTSVVLPNSLKQLGERVFGQCSSLTSVVFRDSLTELGDCAFCECSSLTSLVLPGSLTKIGEQVFQECSSLASVVFRDSLTELGEQAFARCTSLTSVVLPDSLIQIEMAAFAECPSLHSVVLPDSAELGDYVFEQCDALEQKSDLAGFDSVDLYLRDRYKCITLRKLVLRLFRKYNKAVNNSDGTEAEKHASALAQFPADDSGSLEVGLFLQKMNISGGDGEKGLVGYILEFV